MVVCNTSLVTIGDEMVKEEEPLFGKITFHHVGLSVTAVFSLVATVIALGLMFMHATHYSVPHQQKHIIRILFMIPIYACISFVSYVYYKHAIYWEVLRDCYEAFAIASFFTLLCHYLEKDLHDQKEYFRRFGAAGRPLRNWILPVSWLQKCTGGAEKGIFRVPRSGLTWFNVIYVSVFQYCFIRVVFSFVAMITQLFKRYCESSLSPAFGHVWVMTFEALSVTIAMYCLIQFYLQLKDDLAEYRPFLKILCIKLVIFFSFWQSILISMLSSSVIPGGAILKPTKKVAYPDIQVGIPSMLLAIEMSIFAVLHIFAFSWKPYDITKNPDPAIHYQGGFLGSKALWDAFNVWDIVKAAARGFKWLFYGSRYREQDISYETSRQGSMRHPGGKFGSVDTAYSGAPPSYDLVEEQEMGTMRAGSRGRPGPPMRTMSDEHGDKEGLLSHAQGNPQAAPPVDVPRINVREPSPYSNQYGAALSRETSTGYGTPSSELRDPFDPRDSFDERNRI
ncbi:uncharacterized protein PV09_06490 [Verruconis gallopava]|uniref:DUF300-domain-containing protein n=1 Tax=Verruconis gallopava TaxID=253628 RepID=A0A0D2AS30_9PEZI|nr:uncharacterized protein PV09_06490 [Verruconis gallopava]KIW01979.1 hypothetical protein PV09_06490 [Verruconis gallopava]